MLRAESVEVGVVLKAPVAILKHMFYMVFNLSRQVERALMYVRYVELTGGNVSIWSDSQI